ncbi:MAG TPA: DNA-binding response regulator [Lachnospiraceae bacterium]|nr:DNA-binding response regulator [Lachnospiraceae bacterium]
MIYCVEDDNSIRDLMIYTLMIAGFDARGFAESGDFWANMDESLPELILLDIMLPGEDGITILKKLKSSAATAAIPVIMATAKGSEYDRVIGLDLGADDYLCKPFGMMEMVSRIKAVLRRTGNSERRSFLTYGNIQMDLARHVVLVGGREIALTLKEYDLLKLFMEHIGFVFTRDQLLSSVWDQEYSGETRTVDVHIGTLRTKLGSSGEAIHTVRGVGYRLG